MPDRLFDRIEKKKRMVILTAAMREFARNGFEQASTNAIVEASGISKGSLFKYFATKAALFAEVFEFAAETVTRYVEPKTEDLPAEIGPRVVALAELELDMYRDEPAFYLFFNQALKDPHAVVRSLVESQDEQSRSMFVKAMKGAAFPNHISPENREKVLKILVWTLEGLAREWFPRKEPQSYAFRDAYLGELREFVSLILEETHEKEH
jgi:AcrR family transcriptional regulator